MGIKDILVMRDGGYLNVMALHNLDFFFLRWQVIQIISSMCSIDCCAQCSVSYCILSGQSDIVQLFLVAVMYKHINCTKWYMMMSSKIPKTRITPTAWGYSNYKTIHLRGGGVTLLTKLDMIYMYYLTRLVLSILDCCTVKSYEIHFKIWIIHACM